MFPIIFFCALSHDIEELIFISLLLFLFLLIPKNCTITIYELYNIQNRLVFQKVKEKKKSE